ncbi:MAG: hypothetical protein AAF560_33085, partial [Acidobacteriota bacterium]
MISLSILLVAALISSGCVGLAEDIATHLAKQDLKEINQDFTVFEADLMQFRKCLEERGGSCEGDAQTALPASQQHAQGEAVTSKLPGSSTLLASSMNQLDDNNPTLRAYQVLTHPVVAQASGLHHHLRGHDVEETPDVSAQANGESSTITVDLKLASAQHFHSHLMSSIATIAWESLAGHCDRLLAEHRGHSGYPELVKDCRRVTFIRGYLDAYLRNGEFLEVDVQLAKAVQAIQTEGATIEGDIQTLQDDAERLESQLATAESTAIADLGTQASSIGSDVTRLIDGVADDIEGRYGSVGRDLASGLRSLATQAGTLASSLAQQAESKVDSELQSLVTGLDGVLNQLSSKLQELQQKVADVDSDLVNDINQGLQGADAKLSNVFRFSTIGFVSRDAQFQANLPTLDVTLDPTAHRLVTITDADAGNQQITGSTNLSNLGVATDTSGVGTGSKIGAEIVRVFLEALFDAHEGLPAVAPVGASRATGLALGDESLPLFQAPTGNVSATDFNHMTRINDRVATQTRLIVGRVISGIGPFSLNNPPLEDLLVEIISTSVRKAAEKASWCWYACNLDVDSRQLAKAVEKG